MNADLQTDPVLAASYHQAHQHYLACREVFGCPPALYNVSAGGMPNRVKCLHALVGHALAAGAGVPVLGIRGPLEGPGLMLHGAVSLWSDSIEEALEVIAALLRHKEEGWENLAAVPCEGLRRMGQALRNGRA